MEFLNHVPLKPYLPTLRQRLTMEDGVFVDIKTHFFFVVAAHTGATKVVNGTRQEEIM